MSGIWSRLFSASGSVSNRGEDSLGNVAGEGSVSELGNMKHRRSCVSVQVFVLIVLGVLEAGDVDTRLVANEKSLLTIEGAAPLG